MGHVDVVAGKIVVLWTAVVKFVFVGVNEMVEVALEEKYLFVLFAAKRFQFLAELFVRAVVKCDSVFAHFKFYAYPHDAPDFAASP